MLLSNADIERYIQQGDIKIDPFVPENVGPDSIDIRLSDKLLIAKKVDKVIDPQKGIDMEFDEHSLIDGPYAIRPGDFILGSTYEKIGLSNIITAQLEGRSSIGRLGIVIHMTAGLIHAGWGNKTPSTLTLEISSVNPNPVYLYNGMKIAQLSFFKLMGPAKKGYDDQSKSKYSEQQGPLPSRLHHEF